MTHAETSRRRALNAVATFLTALNEYRAADGQPGRHLFMKLSDRMMLVLTDADGLIAVATDVERLQDAIKAGRSETVNDGLWRLTQADHAVPCGYGATPYPSLYSDLFARCGEYVEISRLETDPAEQSAGVEGVLLSAMSETPMQAKALCEKVFVRHNSNAKAALSGLVKRGACKVIRGPRGGYLRPS